MKQNVFVVMPFGRKVAHGFDERDSSKRSNENQGIDFNEVWNGLLKPALERAGCNAFRADSEAAAGDIRTDMFFELVTADLVVADVSIANPNVFYELGVRHGACDRGVFIVTGNVTFGRAFDIAQDRTFGYNGALFLSGTKCSMNAEDHKKELERAVKELSYSLARAIAEDRSTIGSPVYSHLPGLVPANWQNIQTSTARQFHALQDDWLDCVRRAEYEGCPGDILTLADEAPTRLHRTKILYEAALALINLCRYSTAEKVLRDLIADEPNSPHAQLSLARALAHENKTEEAEHTLRTILRQHEDDPHASDLLGQVFRHLWHLAWKDAEEKHEKARSTAQVARMAINSFSRAFRLDARAYYAGFNALILGEALRELAPSSDIDPSSTEPAGLERLATVVEFIAANERGKALERGDYEEQFWATTTLAGIAMVRNDMKTALDWIREAFCIPGTSSFQLQSFRERLHLLKELDVKKEFVDNALEELSAIQQDPLCKCRRVILFAVSEEDDQELTDPELNELTSKIGQMLDHWEIGGQDLAICGGTTRCDVIFAEEILKRCGAVRVMILEPEPEDEPLWPFRNLDWLHRFHALIRQEIPQRDPKTRTMKGVEVWYDNKHLGAFIQSLQGNGGEATSKCSRSARHKRWIINTARIEASQVSAKDNPSETMTGSLHGIFVLGNGGNYEEQNGVTPVIQQILGASGQRLGELMRAVNEFEGYPGEIEIIFKANLASDSKGLSFTQSTP